MYLYIIARTARGIISPPLTPLSYCTSFHHMLDMLPLTSQQPWNQMHQLADKHRSGFSGQKIIEEGVCVCAPSILPIPQRIFHASQALYFFVSTLCFTELSEVRDVKPSLDTTSSQNLWTKAATELKLHLGVALCLSQALHGRTVQLQATEISRETEYGIKQKIRRIVSKSDRRSHNAGIRYSINVKLLVRIIIIMVYNKLAYSLKNTSEGLLHCSHYHIISEANLVNFLS